MKNFHLTSDPCDDVGRVFTPIQWAKWCCKKFGIYESWRKGATIFEPTCGDGSFFRALISIALENGDSIKESDLCNLYGVEINPIDKQDFLKYVYKETGINFPDTNYTVCDFLDYPESLKFDIAVGNPPWINFTDLSFEHKNRLKPEFFKYGLVRNKKDVLLGGSRIDLASLIIQKCMGNHIKKDGNGFFFIPLSLFFNEDANKFFRPSEGSKNTFSVASMFEFETGLVFEKISTRNGFVSLKKNNIQEFPVPFEKRGFNGKKFISKCFPVSENGAWMVTDKPIKADSFKKIDVEDWQMPRQGMNTGGLHKAFILEKPPQELNTLSAIDVFENGYGTKVQLSTEFIKPLIDGKLFSGNAVRRARYILCLHDEKGLPLSEQKVREQFGVWDYLTKHKEDMISRKGVLIQSAIKKGRFWALIGVGPYSFSDYKVVWESLGKKVFRAIVLSGEWQGNQAMHAFIPCNSKDDAERICIQLNKIVPEYLSAFGMAGTCNWAQPGRIKRVIQYKTEKSIMSFDLRAVSQ